MKARIGPSGKQNNQNSQPNLFVNWADIRIKIDMTVPSTLFNSRATYKLVLKFFLFKFWLLSTITKTFLEMSLGGIKPRSSRLW